MINYIPDIRRRITYSLLHVHFSIVNYYHCKQSILRHICNLININHETILIVYICNISYYVYNSILTGKTCTLKPDNMSIYFY